MRYIPQLLEKVSSSNDSMFKAFAQLMSGLKDGESGKTTEVTSQNLRGGFFSALKYHVFTEKPFDFVHNNSRLHELRAS